MFTRTTQIQLWVFAVVTVFSVGAIALLYIRVPDRLGLGTYDVTANFVAGGGLYENANVTFRGVQAGRVEWVRLTDDGVTAQMRINSDVKIPANSTATVKSVSAIGEQYVDFVPTADPSPTTLQNGAVIPEERTAIPQEVAELLREADRLVSSVDSARLEDLLREAFKAFNGSGPELARLLQSVRVLVDKANESWPQTSSLIDQAGPFLEAQIRSGEDIRSLADGLARFTSEVKDADPQLRTLLQTAPDAAAVASDTFSGIRPSFPVLAANLANFGRVGVIYRKSIEQALVIFPALQASLLTIGGQLPADEGVSRISRSRSTIRRRAIRDSSLRPRFARPVTRHCAICPRTCTAKLHRTIRWWCVAREITRVRNTPASVLRRSSCVGTRAATSRSATAHGVDRRCRSTHLRTGEIYCRQISFPTYRRRMIRTRDILSRPGWCHPGFNPVQDLRRTNHGRTSRRQTMAHRHPH